MNLTLRLHVVKGIWRAPEEDFLQDYPDAVHVTFLGALVGPLAHAQKLWRGPQQTYERGGGGGEKRVRLVQIVHRLNRPAL